MRTFLVITLLAGAALLSGSSAASTSGGTPVALVTAESENELLAVSFPDGKVIRRVALPADPENVVAGETGPAVVVSAKGHSVSVLAWHSLRVLRTFRNFTSPHLAAISPDGEWVYVTDDGSGYLSVIGLAHLRIVNRLFVGIGAHHLAFRRDQRQLWVALGEHARRIVVVNTAIPDRLRIETSFDPGFPAHDLAFAPSGQRVWITSDSDGDVRVFDARTRRVVSTVGAGPPPQHLVFGPSGVAYVTSGYGRSIESVSARNGRILRRVSVPYGSFNVTTQGGLVLTSSLLRGTVTELDSRLRVVRTVTVAPAARDVAASLWP